MIGIIQCEKNFVHRLGGGMAPCGPPGSATEQSAISSQDANFLRRAWNSNPPWIWFQSTVTIRRIYIIQLQFDVWHPVLDVLEVSEILPPLLHMTPTSPYDTHFSIWPLLWHPPLHFQIPQLKIRAVLISRSRMIYSSKRYSTVVQVTPSVSAAPRLGVQQFCNSWTNATQYWCSAFEMQQSNECRMNAKWMSNECRMNAKWMSNECRMNVEWMSNECPMNIKWMSHWGEHEDRNR